MVFMRSLPSAFSRAVWPPVMLAMAAMLDQSTRRPPVAGLLITAFS